MRLTASWLASLPPRKRIAFLRSLTPEERTALDRRWEFWARDEQLPPAGDWQTWVVCAGRGFGKTRSGAEWVRAQVMTGCGRVALVAPTAADARDVMVEGESGLLSVCWEGDRDHRGAMMGRPLYEPSKRRITWQNGAQAALFSAEEPERLRGPQHDAAWADELAAWARGQETWDMLQFGLRLGTHPKAMVTTTPKPGRLLKAIMARPDTAITRGSTYDNAANLAEPFLASIRDRYEGTRLGRQELYAEVLSQAEGALWTRDMIEAARSDSPTPRLRRIVVAIDPAITARAESDETGIVAAGIDGGGMVHVLEDCSGRYTPQGWAQAALGLYADLKADRLVAEGNQGGDMVRRVIEIEQPGMAVKIVHASRGKAARAEPVAALYEQGRVRHAKPLPDLEDQLTSWAPLSGRESPDRLDALVWAVTDLTDTKPAPRFDIVRMGR